MTKPTGSSSDKLTEVMLPVHSPLARVPTYIQAFKVPLDQHGSLTKAIKTYQSHAGSALCYSIRINSRGNNSGNTVTIHSQNSMARIQDLAYRKPVQHSAGSETRDRGFGKDITQTQRVNQVQAASLKAPGKSDAHLFKVPMPVVRPVN